MISEIVPEHLAEEAEAARAWFAQDQSSEFKITGIVDPVDSPDEGKSRELQLILCGSKNGQDVCLREHFQVTPSPGGFDVRHIVDNAFAPGSPAPLLDPPPGVRETWLDSVRSNTLLWCWFFIADCGDLPVAPSYGATKKTASSTPSALRVARSLR